jgi:hypothetical protein
LAIGILILPVGMIRSAASNMPVDPAPVDLGQPVAAASTVGSVTRPRTAIDLSPTSMPSVTVGSVPTASDPAAGEGGSNTMDAASSASTATASATGPSDRPPTPGAVWPEASAAAPTQPVPSAAATAAATAVPKSTSTATLPPTPVPTPSDTYYVAITGRDSNPGTSAAPWRTIGKAVAVAPAGSTILVRTGTYAPFTVSRGHLEIKADPGDSPIVSGGTSGIAITASDTTIRGLRVTQASDEGIWVDTVSGIVLDGLRVDHNDGHGIQIIRSSHVQILGSTISANRLSGIRELAGTSSDRYVGNTIADNGHDGAAYNGDGLMLQGSGAYVASNTILRNGDSTTYEHGIYASSLAAGYVITGNTIRDNAASGIKASGQGSVTDNVISGSVRGVVFADSGGTVKVTGNTIDALTYAILVMSNTEISRYQSDYNTFLLKIFGDSGPLDLAGWRLATGLDLHSD